MEMEFFSVAEMSLRKVFVLQPDPKSVINDFLTLTLLFTSY